MSAVRVPRPEVLDRIPEAGHVVIEASAGTGKTYTLEHLIVDLVIEGRSTIDRILAVTFTDKGARELRGRIRDTLMRILAAGPLRTPEKEGSFWTIDDTARRRLEQALARFDEATICTIHSFCHRVLTEHAFDTLHLFASEQVDGSEAFDRAFVEEMRLTLGGDDPARPYLERLLLMGERADDIAGWLYECHKERASITPVFDPAGFERALRAVPPLADLGTIEARLAAGKVNAKTRAAVMRRFADLARTADMLRDRETDLAGALADFYCWMDGGKTVLYLDQKLSQFKDDGSETGRMMRTLEALTRTATTPLGAVVSLMLGAVRERLASTKRRLGLHDYDDMLILVREALQGPNGARLAAALADRYDCALIDEFQDTDEVQWDIFRTLFVRPDRRLFVIGDPKQAIYAFRNADVHTYVAARDELCVTAPPVDLDTSYRASEALVAATSEILLDGSEQAFFTGGRITYPTGMRCGKPSLWAVDGSGAPVLPLTVMHVVGSDLSASFVRQGLYEAIALEIRAITGNGPGRIMWGEGGDLRPVLHGDIHILTRTNTEAREVGKVLDRAGIPHAFFRQDGLLQSEQAEHVLDLLEAVADPSDRSARLRAWLTPFFGLTLGEAGRCADLPSDHPLVRRLLDWHALGVAGRFDRLFSSIAADSGIAGREAFARDSERTLVNVLHVLEILLEESRTAPRTLADLVRLMRAWTIASHGAGDDRNVQRLESERRAVQILTMHKAKGLEAAVVFVAGGFTEGPSGSVLSLYHLDGKRMAHLAGACTPPDVASAIDMDAKQESQRLLYVAMTRARVLVYLPYLGAPPSWAPCLGTQTSAWGKNLKGLYRILDDRLAELFVPGNDGRLARYSRWMRVQAGQGALLAGLPQGCSSPWVPPGNLLVLPADTRERPGELRRAHAGFIITSYSAMRTAGLSSQAGDGPGPELVHAVETPPALRRPGDLPGGLAAGTFLHAVLERVPFESALEHDDPVAWSRLPDVSGIIVEEARRCGVQAVHLTHAGALLHATLRAPLTLGKTTIARGLASADRVLREMELVFPIPEEGHPTLVSPRVQDDPLPFGIRRGAIRGFVDVIFEHAGRVYFADYKSDTLESWDRAALAAHVGDHYALQARIYAVGLVRMLGLHDERSYDARFGGLAYLFMRGMASPDASGVHFERPSFDEVVSWERDLGARRYRTPGYPDWSDA